MNLLHENQRDWVHIVTDYYPEGNLADYIAKKVFFKEHEMVNIIRGILSAITYCHFNLLTIIGNLNPEAIVCDFSCKEYHTRIVNFNHRLEAPYRYFRERMHKLFLERVTSLKESVPLNFAALYLAPE